LTMTWIGMKAAIATASLALLSTNVNAWTSPLGSTVSRVSASGKFGLRMAEDESIDRVQLTSARKEMVFDEAKGRFFETSLETEECIPEEEYCSINDDGSKIRLTMAEKERIFLDALQVGHAGFQRSDRLYKTLSHTGFFRSVVLCEWTTIAPR
jgi:hypothetical protein